ncbi:ABC transporter ATP-binding protein [Aliirhizobium cellulosilyticum]|uniref:Putative ABC transport system ATP-binding protein n=1 Tax=Aliirhizobium cellulosilyticum TaxID=393664 RepID=A0A7W6S8Y4_9HYPH|nr:phosphate ABC transporter ATP-binding protein [Rhizobium cellulosilyticum]MBB4349416.1 putative ABC transport system ATP-binding protein [Rhizobium cellulosilyticum]MBB4412362.1 putative ABC transport system ATP-binding protein [Rhizobium cellulosilyticum]MBB4446994.1 putative ABC transport system ATP-binding protein [Rhizobium cellulosilyticum]
MGAISESKSVPLDVEDVALETKCLSRKLGSKLLVDSVSVRVAKGEILAITGPSGAGKSSYLRLLNRIDEPTSGEVFLYGKNYRDFDTTTLRRRVGMVMQSANLFPGTVKQNLLFGPAQRNESISDDRVDELLAQVGLPHYASKNIDTLSGGEAQRVSFARTLANKPEVLLLDEPTSALDEETSREIERLVVDIASTGSMACLIVTHNLQQAARIAPRTLFLEHGKVAKLGLTNEVLDAYGSH